MSEHIITKDEKINMIINFKLKRLFTIWMSSQEKNNFNNINVVELGNQIIKTLNELSIK